MVIFHSYVSLPEAIENGHLDIYFLDLPINNGDFP